MALQLVFDRRAPPPEPLLRWAYTLLGVAAVLAARFFPFHVLPPVCLFRTWTGHACPACGMTRSWVHMAHGRLGEAVVQNPFGALLFVAMVVALSYVTARSVGWLPAVRLRRSDREDLTLRGAVVAVLLANWAYLLATGVAT